MIKVFLFSSIAITIITCANAQDSNIININGIVKGVEIKKGKVQLVPISISLDFEGYKFDSTVVSVTDNHFHFTGTMPYSHGFETIIFNSPNKNFSTTSFFLDPGNITMICTYDSLEKMPPEINSSKTNEEYQHKFIPEYHPIQILFDSFLAKRYNDDKKYNGHVPDSVYAENQRLRTEVLAKRNSFLKQYIKENPNSFIPLAIIGQSVARINGDLDETEKTFSCLTDKMKNTVSGIKIKKAIQVKKLPSLSKNLNEIKFVDTTNTKTTINLNQNEYTLVDFWFRNCGPCVLQFPKLLSIYETYKNKGFGITGISTDANPDDWKKAILKYNMDWEQLWDKDHLSSTMLLVIAFPTNFLLDKSGNIILENIEIGKLENFLSVNLK